VEADIRLVTGRSEKLHGWRYLGLWLQPLSPGSDAVAELVRHAPLTTQRDVHANVRGGMTARLGVPRTVRRAFRPAAYFFKGSWDRYADLIARVNRIERLLADRPAEEVTPRPEHLIYARVGAARAARGSLWPECRLVP